MAPEKLKHSPPEGGWGWVIVFAAMCALALTIGQLKSYGILMIAIQESLGTSTTITQWVNGLAFGLSFALAPLASASCNKYGFRSVCMVGSVCAGLGISLSYFGNHIGVLFVTYSLLYGVGCSMIVVTSMTIVTQWFDKRVSIALGITQSGAALGSLVIPLVTDLLLEAYNYQGALLICGGITMNLIVCASLYRPLPSPKAKLSSQSNEQDGVTFVNGGVQDNHSENQPAATVDTTCTNSRQGKQCYAETDGGEEIAVKNHDGSNGSKVTHYHSSYSHLETPVEANEEKQPSTPHSADDNTNHADKLFHWDLLKDVQYMTLAIAMVLFYFTYSTTYVLLPTKSKETREVEENPPSAIEDAGLVSTLSLIEMAFRIIWGFVYAHKIMHRQTVKAGSFATLLCLTAIMTTLIWFISTSKQLLVWTIIQGVLVGGCHAPPFVLMLSMNGPEKMASSIGLLQLLQSSALFLGPLLTGSLTDATGSVNAAFMSLAVSMLLASILIAALVPYSAYQTRQQRQRLLDNGDLINKVNAMELATSSMETETAFFHHVSDLSHSKQTDSGGGGDRTNNYDTEERF